ncbi:hypothetical protein DY000_02057218 [Brassica cretica]|uniref:Uncharacterized protein n=1 Tax=Brassica cretica TaxID=69181 RepID=A0ABQ7ACI1_BRACR|nr:hypothetical protein DY000_02057218 [Brassica cretica]
MPSQEDSLVFTASQKWLLVFHEFPGRDDELDSDDEQHDGDELTTPLVSGIVRRRRAEAFGIDDLEHRRRSGLMIWSIREGRNDQPWSPISRCRAASWPGQEKRTHGMERAEGQVVLRLEREGENCLQRKDL